MLFFMHGTLRFEMSNRMKISMLEYSRFYVKIAHQLKLAIIKEKRQSIMKLSFFCNVKTLLKKRIGQ